MSENEDDTPPSSPAVSASSLREDLIATAVKFLQNPKVQSSPLEQKEQFLKKKGLTAEEIEKAIELSGTSKSVVVTQAPATASMVQPINSHSNAVVASPPLPVSTWDRIRDYSAWSIVIGGVVYAVYHIFKKYIEPIFLRHGKEQTERLNKMEQGILEIKSEMNDKMQELQNMMKELHGQLNEQNNKLESVSTSTALYKDSMNSGASKSMLGELQAEITSVKGLLLNTKQFPTAPKVSLGIPDWQKNAPSSHPQNEDNSAINADESGGNTTEARSAVKLQSLHARDNSHVPIQNGLDGQDSGDS